VAEFHGLKIRTADQLWVAMMTVTRDMPIILAEMLGPA
jgi:hypothetical protein